jgi:hypothetical protein
MCFAKLRHLEPSSLPDSVLVIITFFLSRASHAAALGLLGNHCRWALDIW